MKYKKISSSTIMIGVETKTGEKIKNVIVKRAHFDKKHNTVKVFFNATDCSELGLEEGEWVIEDYKTKASYKEKLESWRSGLQLTFNNTASQLLDLFNRRFLGFKINVKQKKITLFKFLTTAEEMIEQAFEQL